MGYQGAPSSTSTQTPWVTVEGRKVVGRPTWTHANWLSLLGNPHKQSWMWLRFQSRYVLSELQRPFTRFLKHLSGSRSREGRGKPENLEETRVENMRESNPEWYRLSVWLLFYPQTSSYNDGRWNVHEPEMFTVTDQRNLRSCKQFCHIERLSFKWNVSSGRIIRSSTCGDS